MSCDVSIDQTSASLFALFYCTTFHFSKVLCDFLFLMSCYNITPESELND